jgi:hypothetical protein
MPSLVVERWTGPEGILPELLELLLSQPAASAPLPTVITGGDASEELHPDPGLAQPPYELAA